MTSTADIEPLLVRVGRQSRPEMLQSLQDAGVQLNAHAQTLLAHPVFDAPSRRTARIVERTVEQLGFEHGGVQSRILAAARHQGLELCTLATGPYLRLAMMDQANAPDSVLSAGRGPTGAIHIASEPVSDDVEHPKGFYLRVVDGQPWLRGYCCDDTYVWAPGQRLAFHSPEGFTVTTPR